MIMEINKKLAQDISSYCKLNGLDENKYLNDLLLDAFMVDKYGNRPSILGVSKSQVFDQEPPMVVSNYSFTVEFKNDVETLEKDKTSIKEQPKKRTRKLVAK